MLNSNEEARLQTCIKALKSGKSLTAPTQLWLALNLERLQAELRVLKEDKTKNPDSQLIIKQAKHLMMLKYAWTEQEAHRYVHRAAMNARTTKFQIAKQFLDKETQ
jgi:AmiR/NasT family two-component response regulator